MSTAGTAANGVSACSIETRIVGGSSDDGCRSARLSIVSKEVGHRFRRHRYAIVSSAEQAARAYLDAATVADESAMRAALAEDAVLVLPRPSSSGLTIKGGANIAAFVAGLGKRYVGSVARYGAVVANETTAAVEWRRTAKLAENGADYDQYYCWIFEVVDGKIVELREYTDTDYGRRNVDSIASEVLARHATEDA